MTDKRLMCGLVGMYPEYMFRWMTAEDGPGLRELHPLSSWNVVQLNALWQNEFNLQYFSEKFSETSWVKLLSTFYETASAFDLS